MTSPDGFVQIEQVKASTNLKVRDTGCGTAFDYLVVAGGCGAQGSVSAWNASGGGGAGASIANETAIDFGSTVAMFKSFA